MTLLKTLKEAISVARTCILENLDQVSELTGEVNPYGDKTLLLDTKTEDMISDVLLSADVSFDILSEEKGLQRSAKKSEYLAIIDPIDGSTNLKRGIPLVTVGVSVVPYQEVMSSDDIEISIIDSIFTNEIFTAVKDEGVSKNGKKVRVSNPIELKDAIISYNTRGTFDSSFLESSLRTIGSVHDIRRTASPLLDLCWTAAGHIDGVVDIRNMLPVIHISGVHMVSEAGGFVMNPNGKRYTSLLNPEEMMNFVAASSEDLARQILIAFQG
ncbi:MAG: inositol monophosphatase family protein [Candidatus Thorarchaeota archaeon]